MGLKRKQYTQEFKDSAVKLVTERGYKLSEASRSLGPCLTPQKINHAISTSFTSKKHRLALHFCLFALNDRFQYSSW